jgi:hypothetical protein
VTPSYNPPPGWNVPLHEGKPADGFQPDPSWPEAPDGWKFWVREGNESSLRTREKEVGTATAGSLISGDYDFGPALVDDDRALLQAMGVYRYHHPLESAVEYENRLDSIRDEISEQIKGGTAIHSDTKFLLENSVAKGTKLTKDLSLLCLRSFNSESENAMRTMKAGSLELAKGRLTKSRQVIERLGIMMSLRISDEYFDLRIRELELVSDHLVKKQEEKEAQREERARLREEKSAAQELEAERDRLQRDLEKYLGALEKAGTEIGDEGEIQTRIAAIREAIETNDYRLQNVRAGYVYVISNPGAFGEGMVKIGMTRRLDPMDRIKELGDASVPFPFEVHLLHFAQDAVSLETQLHQTFANKKVNLVNLRKEFFFVEAGQVKRKIVEGLGLTVEFTEEIVSEQYLQSKGSWPS